MKGIGLVRMVYQLDFEMSTNFIFQNSHVKTLTSKGFAKMFPHSSNGPKSVHGVELPKEKRRESKFGYLLIEPTFELEEYDALNEGSAKIRPQLLVIHGILSFLTNNIFISFQSFTSSHFMVSSHIIATGEKNKLTSNGVKFDFDLNKILVEIESANSEKKILIFTLFERWRKALYLEIESEEHYIHFDESILAYIHIMEVLSDEFKENFKNDIAEKREQAIAELIKCASIPEEKSVKKLSSLINKLAEIRVTLKQKVLQMLSELNLLNPKTKEIVLRFIEYRNAIAHGRPDIYQDKVVFPLKPFFSLIKDIDENLESIKILSAKTISNYLGLNAWEDEWHFLLATEFTPLYIVKDFINTQKFIGISNQDFLSGQIEGIIPLTLAYYYLKDKISFLELERTLKNIILTSKNNEKSYKALFYASISLSDSSISDLAEKARQIVQTVDTNGWGYHANIRDILKEYEYHGLTLIWFKEWLLKR